MFIQTGEGIELNGLVKEAIQIGVCNADQMKSI